MSILAIETSSTVSSVAVMKNGVLAAELTMQAKLTHSETLLPHIGEVLKMAHEKKDEISAVAVSIGPGSFTGLRIGVAVAKSMAYALGIPIIPVPTLEALATHFLYASLTVVPLIDAQKNNVYYAVYDSKNGELVEKSAVQVASLSDIFNMFKDRKGEIVFLGDGINKLIRTEGVNQSEWFIAPPQQCMPRAANVAYVGERMLKGGITASVMDLEPIYIRRSEAEELWERRNAGEGF